MPIPRRKPLHSPERSTTPRLFPADLTVGQQWRLRRNLAICDLYLSCDGRWSQRMLADVFDLPRSRIAEILREFRDLAPLGAHPPRADNRGAVAR